jgi:hypothetical protein
MNRRVRVSPIVVLLAPNHIYSQTRQSEYLLCPERDAGVKCARGWRHLSRISDVSPVARVTGLKVNTTWDKAVAKYYDIWQAAWFLLSGIKEVLSKRIRATPEMLRCPYVNVSRLGK